MTCARNHHHPLSSIWFGWTNSPVLEVSTWTFSWFSLTRVLYELGCLEWLSKVPENAPHHLLMLPPIPQFTMPVYTLDMMGLIISNDSLAMTPEWREAVANKVLLLKQRWMREDGKTHNSQFISSYYCWVVHHLPHPIIDCMSVHGRPVHVDAQWRWKS